MKMPPSIPRKEKGQSLVELALVFTLLLLLLTGIIDLGSMFYTYTALQDTAQEGAIYASTHPTDRTGIVERIKQSASYPIDASNITIITVTCSGVDCLTTNNYSCQGKPIMVTVIYTYNLIMPIIPTIIGPKVDLKANITNTILRSPGTIAQICP
jgi:Flp pilus assembly protein TadG